jgi:hypothetical protein
MVHAPAHTLPEVHRVLGSHDEHQRSEEDKIQQGEDDAGLNLTNPARDSLP